ncbi:MAG: fibrobacter succinogenes major paralogous domain-containing protein [Bacteroidota bacterium]|jgi:uncharacterized protein (TIGR02145 family)
MNKLFHFVCVCILFSFYGCEQDGASPGNGNSNGNTTAIVLTTNAASSITGTTAVSGGNITSDGGSSIIGRGVCWSTSPNPTLVNSFTSDGAGIGSFNSNLTSLSPNTSYYVRAYASNANSTVYGNQISFTTSSSGGGGSGSCSGGPSTVTDIDGNVYNVVTIGNQCWLKENLETTRYRNGDVIPTNLNNSQWQNTTQGAWAYYNDSSQYNNIYGKLYNWYAVADARGLCPTGWHVPTDSEWNKMVKYLDPLADTSQNIYFQSQTAGGMMKSIGDLQSGTGYWQAPNAGASNSSGFEGRPGGQRSPNSIGGQNINGAEGHWWSASLKDSTAWFWSIGYNNPQVLKYYNPKRYGFSIRCLRD